MNKLLHLYGYLLQLGQEAEELTMVLPYGDMDMDGLHLVVWISASISVKVADGVAAPSDAYVYMRGDSLIILDQEGMFLSS